MTSNERRELIIACRDLAGMHTDQELKDMLDWAPDPAALADTMLEGSIECDNDDDILSPLETDEDLARDILRAMLELRFNQIDR